ncbi:MAG: hypothetical protein WC315_06120 [Candidatus Omnitrophota bacterium]|jgi:hypothetical protein
MKEKFAKLIDVKTIVTFAIVADIIILSFKGTIEPKDIVLFGGMILTYFFNKDKKPEV